MEIRWRCDGRVTIKFASPRTALGGLKSTDFINICIESRSKPTLELYPSSQILQERSKDCSGASKWSQTRSKDSWSISLILFHKDMNPKGGGCPRPPPPFGTGRRPRLYLSSKSTKNILNSRSTFDYLSTISSVGISALVVQSWHRYFFRLIQNTAHT